MMVFLETNSVALMYNHLSKSLEKSFVDFFQETTEGVDKIDLNNWSDLADQLGGGIFDTTETVKLVNINELEITKKVATFLQTLDSDLPTYFYSTTKQSLKAAEKKLWKSQGFTYTELKNLKKPELRDLATLLNTNNGLALNTATVNKIVELSDNVDELMNNMELISLSDNQVEIIKNLSSKEVTPAYMLQFDAGNRIKNLRDWLAHSNDEEIQLTLSIIFGKLKKQSSRESQNALKALIKTDQNIKTNSNVPSTVWFKYFLWQVKNNQYAF